MLSILETSKFGAKEQLVCSNSIEPKFCWRKQAGRTGTNEEIRCARFNDNNKNDIVLKVEGFEEYNNRWEDILTNLQELL